MNVPIAHIADVVAKLLAEDVPSPSSVTFTAPTNLCPTPTVTMLVRDAGPIATWAREKGTTVTATAIPGGIEVAAAFVVDGVEVRVWDHINDNATISALYEHGCYLEYRRPEEVDPAVFTGGNDGGGGDA